MLKKYFFFFFKFKIINIIFHFFFEFKNFLTFSLAYFKLVTGDKQRKC